MDPGRLPAPRQRHEEAEQGGGLQVLREAGHGGGPVGSAEQRGVQDQVQHPQDFPAGPGALRGPDQETGG